jgi:hypothetical protein
MLATDDLERLWERLADAIDTAGPDRERLFLAKLALVLANELADPSRTEILICAALDDLT